MSTENIDIRIREDGSRVVSRNLRDVGDAADSSADSLALLKQAALALGAAFAVDKLMQWADTWGTAAGTIRIATNNLNEAATVQDKLFDLAQRTRSEYSSVVELFGRASLATKDLGATQQQVLEFTEGVGKALAIQGTNAQTASGALIQLSQVLGSGKAEMADYRSLIDTAPVILKTVADNIDGTGGSVARLTQMVRDGKISSKQFFEAFLAGSEQLDEKFQKTSTLFGQAWVIFSNGMSKYIGQMNEALGISDKFTAFAQWMSANMPTIGAVVAGVGVAIAVAFAPALIMQFVGAMKLLWAVLLANPFTAVLALLAGVVTTLYMMRDAIKLGIDDTTTLGDLMRATWEALGPIIDAVAGTVEQVFINFGIWSGEAYKKMNKDSTDHGKHSEAVWLNMIRWAARTVDAILGMFIGLYDGIKRVFGVLADNLSQVFENIGLAKDKLLEGEVTAAIQQINKNQDVWKDTGAKLGQAMRDGLDTGFGAMAEGGFEAKLDQIIARAKELGQLRTAAGADGGGGGGSGAGSPPQPPTDPDALKKAARELDQLKRALEQLRDRADPVGAAVRDLARAEDTFAAAVAKGLIPKTEAIRLMDRLREQYREALDPLGTMQEELQRETDWLKLSNAAYRIESELFSRVQQLRREGVDVTKEQTDALRDQIAVRERMAVLAQTRDMLEQDMGAFQMDAFKTQLEAFKQLMQDPAFVEGDIAAGLQRMLPWANLDGTQEQMAAFTQLHADMYAQIAALEDQGVIKHQTAEMLKAQADQMYMDKRLQWQRNFFGTLAQLSSSSNRKLAAIGRAAAVTQAVIDGVAAVQKALASSAPPYNYVMAAAVGAVAAANVASIMSQPLPGYRTGGEFMVGGGGVSDSQVVAFRATPGERVTVTPPGQQGPGEDGMAVRPEIKLTNLNLLDPSIVGQYLNTPEGEEVLVNVMQKNGYSKN